MKIILNENANELSEKFGMTPEKANEKFERVQQIIEDTGVLTKAMQQVCDEFTDNEIAFCLAKNAFMVIAYRDRSGYVPNYKK